MGFQMTKHNNMNLSVVMRGGLSDDGICHRFRRWNFRVNLDDLILSDDGISDESQTNFRRWNLPFDTFRMVNEHVTDSPQQAPSHNILVRVANSLQNPSKHISD
jgi:hypothetical protein